jgi:cell division septum initiation protein DivIVA
MRLSEWYNWVVRELEGNKQDIEELKEEVNRLKKQLEPKRQKKGRKR